LILADLDFFGQGGSSSSTEGWIPKELSEYYGDLSDAEMNEIRLKALGAVIRPILNHLPENLNGKDFKDLAEKGKLSPLHLEEIEEYFEEQLKKNPNFIKEESKKGEFKGLLDKFTTNVDMILKNFEKDATFISDRISKAKAHVHVSHHPIHSDLGYFDEDERGSMTGGMSARRAILDSGKESKDSKYKGYTLGLYGHTHKSGVDVLQKENGGYFFGVSTKGLNYDTLNNDEKVGLTEMRNNLKGEFAEIGVDDNHELTYVTTHKVSGKNIYDSSTKSRNDILNEKENYNNERVESFNTLDYKDSSVFKKKR
jgi:hypothetical protein